MAQKVQKGPKFGQLQNKKMGQLFITKIDSTQKNFFNLTSTPNLAPKDQKDSSKGQKSAKGAPNVAKLKTKR